MATPWKLPHAHPAIPGGGKVLTPAHQEFHHYSNPAIWGALADESLHNPFRDHDFEEYPDALGHAGHAWESVEDAHPDYVRAFHDRYAKHLAAAHPVMAVPAHVVPQIMREGRLKSQFEVRPSEKSSSYYDTDGRARIEHLLFNYPKPEEGFPDHARPIYGHLSAHPYTDTSTSSYGTTSFVLHKPAIWHRSTFSGDDSWGRLGAVSAVPLGDYAAHPHRFRHAIPLDHLDMENRDVEHMSPSTMARRMEERTPDDRADAFWRHGDRLHQQYNYPELQIHGGLNTPHIRFAIVRSPDNGHPTKMTSHAREATEALTGAGIPWIHTVGYRKPTTRDHAFTPEHGARPLPPAMAATGRHSATLLSVQALGAYDPHVHYARPSGGGWLLTHTGTDGQKTARAADPEWGISQARPLGSFLARGYWQPLSGPVRARDVLSVMPHGATADRG